MLQRLISPLLGVLFNRAAFWIVCALLTGCVTPARLPSLDQVHASTPEALDSADGTLSRKRSHAILAALAKQAGATDNLLRHVAVEDVVSGSPLVIGNKVTLLRDGPATYRAMYQSIRAAKHHINLEVFILEDDAVGEQLIALHVKLQQQGVQVNLIYDAVGSAHTPDELFAPLEHAGGKIVKFNPVNPAKAPANWAVDHR